MQLIALGTSSSVPRPGRACSCYAVRTPATTLLLDLGTGALGNLRRSREYTTIDAVVISHMHADHFLDLIPLRYGLKYGPDVRERRQPLYLPPGGEAVLRRLVSAFAPEGPADFLDEVFEVCEYDPRAPLHVGDAVLRFRRARHYIDTYAIRVEAAGAVVVYSGDTAPCDAMVEHAAGASLFLCEATLGVGSETPPRGHCSAAEAGEMARRAEVARLMLTHYGSAQDPELLCEAAAEAFGGVVTVADDGDELAISSPATRPAAAKTESTRVPAQDRG